MFNSLNHVGVVAAHPDDELLGMGGTLKRLTAKNAKVAVLFLSSGVGARAVVRESPESRRAAATEALMTLGISDITFANFPDNKFGTVPKLSIIKCVEDFLQAKASISVFTNSSRDLNEDHRITAEATLVACRPTPASKVESLYHFETLSSSEWNFGTGPFQPNVFVNIEESFSTKVLALQKYVSELEQFPHPRSIVAVEALASLRGSQVGFQKAEAFELGFHKDR